MADGEQGRATWRLPPEVAARLRDQAEPGQRRVLPRGRQLYAQGDAAERFFVIVAGTVSVFMLREDGTEVLLEIMGPDSLCGEGAVFSRTPHFSTATALTETQAIAYGEADIRRIVARQPDIALDLLRCVAEKQRVAALKLTVFSRDPEERILELLTRQAMLFGEATAEGCLIRTQLTHERMAAMIGASRVTVTRALSQLRERGILAQRDGWFVLPGGPEA